MSRRPDPARIDAARRAAATARLRSAGYPPTDAERLVDAFTAEHDGRPDRAAWDGFDAWLGRRGRDSPRPMATDGERSDGVQPGGRHDV